MAARFRTVLTHRMVRLAQDLCDSGATFFQGMSQWTSQRGKEEEKAFRESKKAEKEQKTVETFHEQLRGL